MPEDGAGHRLFAALYDPVMWPVERLVLRPHRAFLARDLTGTVLDLGCGTGAMFPFFAEHADAATVHAVEPDPHMRRRAAAAAQRAGLAVDIRDARGESLPYAADTFDAVVSAMALCTVDDVEATLDEVARVLRDGGEFRFLEHVRARGLRGGLQDRLAPAWHAVAGGCHPNRETGEQLAGRPDFEVVDLTRLDIGALLAKPFVRGTARRV